MLERVVISLTTLPHRYPVLLETLRSLQAQTVQVAAIYLGLPQTCARTNATYPPLPREIEQLVTIVPLEVDHGPICKLLAALEVEHTATTHIITVDDDVIYAPNFVEALLLEAQRYPAIVIASSGFRIGGGFPFYSSYSNCQGAWNRWTSFNFEAEVASVDVVAGFSGVLYPRHVLDKDELIQVAQYSQATRTNDDVVISAVVKGSKLVSKRIPAPLPQGRAPDPQALSYFPKEFLLRLLAAVKDCQSLGYFAQPVPQVGYATLAEIILWLLFFALLFGIALVGWFLYVRSSAS